MVHPTFTTASAPWLDGWDYRQGITITGSSGAGTYYQIPVNVTYDANMQVDFDDIVYTDNDGITLLDFWRQEKVNSAWAYFWVEVIDNLDTDQTIFMYYGNATVSTASDGDATFPLLYDDWTIESMQESIWDRVTTDGSVSWSGVDAVHGSVLKIEGGVTGSYRETYESDYDTNASFAFMSRAHLEDTTNQGTNTIRLGTSGQSYIAWALIHNSLGTRQFRVRDSDNNPDDQTMTADSFDDYFVFQITRDGTYARLYRDGVLIETGSCDPDANAVPAAFMQVRDTEYDMYVDWVCIRKFVTTEPVARFGMWEDVNSATAVLHVLIHPWGLNTGYIILGMILVPASGIYLVKGGRKEASMDKVFFALIAFMIGWALIVGGILP